MPPQSKPKPAEKYEMPAPPPVVLWRPCPGGEPSYAIVTKRGSQAISLILFPTESRGGVPKDGVRYINDPQAPQQFSSDSGVWDLTDESMLLRALAKVVVPDESGKGAPITPELIAFVNRNIK